MKQDFPITDLYQFTLRDNSLNDLTNTKCKCTLGNRFRTPNAIKGQLNALIRCNKPPIGLLKTYLGMFMTVVFKMIAI